MGQEIAGRGVGPVQIVQAQHQAGGRREGLKQRAQRAVQAVALGFAQVRGGAGGQRGNGIVLLALDLVANADRNLVEHIQHVELGNHPPVHAIDHLRVTQKRQVDPATAAGASCNCAVLIAARAELIGDCAFHLAGKRAATHAGAISFGYADYGLNRVGRNAGPCGRAACGAA